jgi:hypothetical protein
MVIFATLALLQVDVRMGHRRMRLVVAILCGSVALMDGIQMLLPL